jgi:hypothetical protein
MSTESGAAAATGALSGVGSTVRGGAGGFLALAGIAEHVEGSGKGDHWAQAGLLGDGICLAQAYLGEAWATPIIAAGLTALTAYSLACGFPFTPDEGAKFANGAAEFGKVGLALGAAQPTWEWTGSGSDTYGRRCLDQLELAQRMADADDRLHAILADQAQQIRAARDMVDQSATVLGISIPVAMALLAFGPLGFVDSELIQIAATVTALGVATPAMEKLMSEAAVNAARIRNVAGDYSQVAADASRTGSVAGFGPSADDVAPSGTARPTNPPAAKPGPAGTPPSGGAPSGTAAPGAGTPGAPHKPAAPGEGLPDGGSGASGAGVPRGVAPGGGASAAEAAPPPPASAVAPADAAVAPVSAGAGAPSGGLPGLPGAVPGGGGSGVLASMLGPATQAATQALGQAGQGATPAPAGAQSPPPAAVPGGTSGQGATPGTRPAALGPEQKPIGAVSEPEPEPDPEDHAVADGAGPVGPGARAPIHVEIELDPNQLTAPVHVVLDPKNAMPGSSG